MAFDEHLGLSFRKVKPEDERELHLLHNECIKEISYPAEFFFKATHGCEGIEGWVCTTATSGGRGERLVGFVTVQVASSNHVEGKSLVDFIFLRPSDHLYILTLGVQEKYRHCGVATRLLDEVKRYTAKVSVDAIYLHALASNHKAIKFYTKNQFVCQKRLTGFYTLNSSEVHDGLLFCFSPAKALAQASDQCSLLPLSLFRKLLWF
ncbi:acetyltransferase [Chloropicon primus]|uniref:N-alpha-acetyltransferase 60 n=1 Tax=Chloropicon primus TaxID=1764295 RepID=A0A5B8MEY1_9CHLO|nr:acetyltransferase [Chloropicon primus]UPQ98406.1 acetyltransferase [Chloropicon primus]|mmetsp:Transcript_4690/g.13990  ORF Transcript_4690/g.13990 Transcript_4690/m.13990 type:complete len:207 (+) Transcript_4690:119-739(+)|eukprot:QDZ19198.1 acetyltransferase [Chloropicon primus]